MRYGVKKVRKFDEWKKEANSRVKEFATDEEMIFPAMLMLGIGGSAVVSSIEPTSIPGLILGGTMALYGLTHTSTILLGNINFDEVKDKIRNRISKVMPNKSVEEEYTHRK